MMHLIGMVVYLVLAIICLVGGLDEKNTIAFWSFLILSGIEKVCMKLESNQ